jgi:hypothetical protein
VKTVVDLLCFHKILYLCIVYFASLHSFVIDGLHTAVVGLDALILLLNIPFFRPFLGLEKQQLEERPLIGEKIALRTH